MVSTTSSVSIGETIIAVDVVRDTASIRTGLSGRESLPLKNGMLFIFPRPKQYRFWMKDMLFPIDIIWIRGNFVVGITEYVENIFDRLHPRFYKAPEKTDCVLEVNAGFAEKKKIHIGDKVIFNNVYRDFLIVQAGQHEKNVWNIFIEKNQPIVGAFLETWEWGEFQEKLGHETKYYFVKEKNTVVAIFMLTFYPLPFGLCYGYASRGPVIAKNRVEEEIKYFEILKAIQRWAKKELPSLVFLRLEPSLISLSEDIAYYGFRKPSYHVQPLRNTLISLEQTEEEILARFHSSTRSNIGRAERREVTCEIKNTFTEQDYRYFFSMIKSTISRNHGKKAYPTEKYFRALLSGSRILGSHDIYNPAGLSLVIFCGYHAGKPATTHIVIFCGTTATYLFGASHAEHLNSKVDTYLHWIAIREAKKRGMLYYDIGGIDEKIWPSLTKFKRQFGGDEINYVGNIDIPLNQVLYYAYNFYKKTLKKIHRQA